ncbi:MAG TPA: molybdopterin cofactor-binding domain-containing protein [Chitinophagaceae bacterium]|nr:molybdopterin cofactor-binding domain-containing protein [Chitinophagaceae bacterium]
MIHFILNNKEISTDLKSGTTLLDFIRYHHHLMGTKIGCREGDCGACTVLVGEIKNGQLRYKSMTSCLMPLGNTHGKHIVTIEGINFTETPSPFTAHHPQALLNPIQQAMADEGATQCGFCTPGFVMSLAGFCLNGKDATTENAIAAVDGNICRCTGYKSIERACHRVAQLIAERKNDDAAEFVANKEILPSYFASIKERLQALTTKTDGQLQTQMLAAHFVGGGTDLYVQKHDEIKDAAIRFLFDHPELNGIAQEGNKIVIGPSATVTDLKESPVIQNIFPEFDSYAKLVSSTPIRNMATIAGNFINASPIGDFTVFFLALDAQLIISDGRTKRELPLRKLYKGYKQLDKRSDEYIEKIWFELPNKNGKFNFEKVSKRTCLDIASVNTAVSMMMDGDKIIKAGVSAGGVAPIPLYLQKTSDFLIGKTISEGLIREAIEIAQGEISPISDARGSAEYKRSLLGQLIKAHFVFPSPKKELKRAVNFENSFIVNEFQNPPLGDRGLHVRGESIYLDDIPLLNGTLYAAVFDSPVAHGKIVSLELSEAEKVNGVVRIFTHKDITGENQIGGIIPDEELLAGDHVHFCGMPIAIVVAETDEIARAAIKKIKVEIEPLPVITDPREAKEKGELIIPPRTFKLGDVDNTWDQCEYIYQDRTDTNGQEHLYIETQGAYSFPTENNAIKIYSSTQGPTAVQRTAARVLGIPMHRIEVDTMRLGGGFGGKEDQATAWGVICALATHHLKRPVKYSLHRMEDMRMTGKRHPYSSDFKIGLSKDLKILAYEVTFFQNAGAAADLSPAVMERTLFHCTNSYFIPNVKATAYSCRTNLPPNTAFRGFGGPQGMFVIEAAIAKAAEELGIPASEIQQRNLLKTGDEFPYGQIAESEANECWKKVDELYHIKNLEKEIDEFNAKNKFYKKGMALMPICFGISFTKTRMNQARSLVHIYTDGSVGISTGAVEMGQGVNAKILQVAEKVFSIEASRIKIQSTSTFRVANTSPTAASAAADLNGKATLIACTEILKRLKQVAADELKTEVERIEIKDETVWMDGKQTHLKWDDIVMITYNHRVSLSEHGHYTPPGIYFDPDKEKGHPFAYHTYGTAIVIATIDCLRGCYEFDSVKVVHDFGSSMNKMVDLGQCEGGIVQGIGWMTVEELLYNKEGKLMTNALSTYKVPDIYSAPKEILIHFLSTDKNNLAIFKSKAVGEPPLMYGIGSYFALRNAIKAFNSNVNIKFDAPMTPERVLMNLYAHPLTVTKASLNQEANIHK